MDIQTLAAFPLWKLYRARAGWMTAGNADLVAAANAAIDLRIELIATGVLP